MLDLELYHPYRWLIVSVFGAVLLLSLTVRRQVLGWQLLVLGERVDSVVVSIDRSGYRVRTANGVIVHLRKAGSIEEILTGRHADVGDQLAFYWIPSRPATARIDRFAPVSALLFMFSLVFIGLVPVGVVAGRRKAQRERITARV